MADSTRSPGFDAAGSYLPAFPEPMSPRTLDQIRLAAQIIEFWVLDREVELLAAGVTEDFEHVVQTQVVLANTRLLMMRLSDEVTRRLGDCRN